MTPFGREYALAYDLFYQEKDYERECDFIEAVFKKYHGDVKEVLDLGCGTGGHSIILARRGYHVVGVDRSKDMLDIAINKTKGMGLPLRFIQGDITDLAIPNRYDAVISMFAVMGYQTTNAALSGACLVANQHLSKDGIFLFDSWHGPAVLKERPGNRLKEIKKDNGGQIIRFTEPFIDIITHTVETRFRVLKLDKDRLTSETHESHLMRFFFPQEIRYFLEVAGFRSVEYCPFLDLENRLSEDDWNMTVIAGR